MPRFKFSDIAVNVTDKRMPTPDDKELYIAPNNLDTDTLSVPEYGYKVDLNGTKLIMHKGDMLFGRREPQLKKAAIAPHDGLFSAHGMIFHPKEDVITKEFFPFFISSDYFFDAAIRISVGSLSPTVNWKDLKDLEFSIPEFEEQQKYANILWAIIRSKKAYKELIKKTDELVKSQFIELFGDPVSNDKHWPMVPLRDCLYGIDSGRSLNCEGHPRSGELPAVLKLSAVTYGVYNPEENKELPTAEAFVPELKVHAGDLLFSRKNTREYVGITALVKETPKNLMLPDLIFRLLPKECIRTEYLHQLINHTQYRPVISGLASGSAGSMPNISKQRLLALSIPLPPIEIQITIEPLVEQSDKSKFEAQQTLKELTDAQKALMKKIFE